jgi:hypothetical protein
VDSFESEKLWRSSVREASHIPRFFPPGNQAGSPGKDYKKFPQVFGKNKG